MPKANDGIILNSEVTDLRKLGGIAKKDIQVGRFYSKLDRNTQGRFKRIVGSLVRKLNLNIRSSPAEMLLIRQIAYNSIRIENAEKAILSGEQEIYSSDAEKWLFLAQKERRDAISLLDTMTKVAKRRKGIGASDLLRGVLRESEELDITKHEGTSPDAKDRRTHNDGIHRSY